MNNRYFERTCIRIGETASSIKAWAEGEKLVGLNNSLFICENGVVVQYCDGDEGEVFFKMVENMIPERFDEICDEFFQAIKNKDLIAMHEGLAVFNEMDEYDLGTEDMKRRLKRIRESTQEEAYKLKDDSKGCSDVFNRLENKGGRCMIFCGDLYRKKIQLCLSCLKKQKDFICYKGEIYTKHDS